MIHDIVRIYDTAVQCRCGRWFDGDTITEARRIHDAHYGLMEAREALTRKEPPS